MTVKSSIEKQLLILWPSLFLITTVLSLHLLWTASNAEQLIIIMAIVFFVFILVPLSNRSMLIENPNFVLGEKNTADLKKSFEAYADMLFAFSFSVYLNVCQLLTSLNGVRALLTIPFLYFGSLAILELSKDERFFDTFLGSTAFKRSFVMLSFIMVLVVVSSLMFGSWSWIYKGFQF
jgi:hypothetical protein